MIEKYTLNNGLRIVLEPVPTVRSVAIGIWVLTGSRNETEKNSGISHFLEHMLFKGTEKRNAQEIAESFDSIGGFVNAFTAKEYTCYYARVLDSYKEHALEVLTDMFFNSLFLEDELEREKKVVMEEIKMYEDTPDDHVHTLLSKAAYGTHSLGRSILGTEKHLQSFTRETLINYMDDFYTPNNVVVSIAGNVDGDFVKQVESMFSTFDRTNTNVKRIVPKFNYDKVIRNKETEQAHVCFGYEGLAANDESHVGLTLINSALGGGMSSRLFQEIREKRGLAYSVYSYHTSYLDSGMVVVYAGTNKEQLPLLIDSIEETVDRLVEDGMTEAELHNNKERLKGSISLSLESTNSRMSRNGRNELLLQKHRTLNEVIRDIDAVNMNKINTIIQDVFAKGRAEAIIKPEK